jgi:CDP-diacylglycerol--glycerol-3-phosphate 3-phosphatidyltransferase
MMFVTVAGMVSPQNTTEASGKQPRELSSKVDPLHPDALNLPNLITLSRLVLALVLFVLIYIHDYWVTAAVVFLLAAATDALDGYLARRYGTVTALGRILDPFADKIIICGAFIFLLDKKVATPSGELWSGVNAWMVIIVVAREMFVTSLRGFLEQQGKDFSATMSGKLKMVLQCVAVTASLLSLEDRFSSDTFKLVRDVLLWSAVAVTVWSGLIYVVRAVAILRGTREA